MELRGNLHEAATGMPLTDLIQTSNVRQQGQYMVVLIYGII